MRDPFRILLYVFLLLQISHSCYSKAPFEKIPVPAIPFNPKTYICDFADLEITVDGIADEKAWSRVSWTDEFVDIEGESKPKPEYSTRVKMLWDNTYLYIFAEMEEPHLWATLTERDAVIYHDNDFEVFIDPDGDTHNYIELEINALGTVWDLLLTKPYRDDGHAIDAFDIPGLKTAVHLDGTLNDPSDIDKGWSVELAIPFSVFQQVADVKTPPELEYWRVNFSRVQWKLEHTENGYSKAIDPKTDKPYPESNWVWSPQGLVAMHYPEMWGYVFYDNQDIDLVSYDFPKFNSERLKWWMRQVYYAQRQFADSSGHFADSMEELKNLNPFPFWSFIECYTKTVRGYELIVGLEDTKTYLMLSEDGRIRGVPIKNE
ncbi:carbohydrate-binding family 9-like protein [bacterium]|nr:carbohydrate-binding family 9-like protein [bacterium]